MRGKVVHCKREAYDIYIGRPSTWGNPWSHKQVPGTRWVETREQAIEAYRQELWLQIKLGVRSLEELAELDGKTLGCWCAPNPCHGDVLVRAAEWACSALMARPS